MDNLYTKGQLLRLHTKNDEVVEGRFHSINEDTLRISLYGVKELPKGILYGGVCHYYEAEVRNITKLQDVDELASDITTHLKISERTCEELLQISKKYVYINQVDSSFHDAIKDLNHYSYIAVSTDGASMGRNNAMPFIVLSTPSQIYIFDIQSMQFHAFDAGLKSMLEAEYPKKIVHDCRKLSDCLYHKHNTTLKGVFDTQVGDLIVTKNKNGVLPTKVRSLADCLTLYLGLPTNVIEEKFDIVQCSERPLSITIKDSLAKNIAFLHQLSETINTELKIPFTRGVECYLENLRSCDGFKAWDLSGKQDQLPKEFTNCIEY